MKKPILTIIVLLFYTFTFSQEKRVEEVYQECLYNSLSDKGIVLKKYAKGFEDYLIESKILENNSPKSYYKLLKSISEGKRYNSSFKYSFIDSINKIEKQKIIPFNLDCYNKMLKLKKFKKSKFYKIQLLIAQNEKLYDNYNYNNTLKKMASILDPGDFDMDYYKQRIYVFLYFSNILYEQD